MLEVGGIGSRGPYFKHFEYACVNVQDYQGCQRYHGDKLRHTNGSFDGVLVESTLHHAAEQTLPLLRLLLSSKCTPHRYRGAASRLAPRLQWLTHPCCYDIVLCVPPRRGRWYGRMAINLVHLKRKVAAWRVSVTALEDPAVIGGDRLSLQRRLARLEKQLGAQTLQRARVFTHAAPVRVLAALQESQQRARSSCLSSCSWL